MKRTFTWEHEGTDRVDSVQEFCRLKKLKYIGSFVRKADREIVPDVIQAAGKYYMTVGMCYCNHGDKQTTVVEFRLFEEFNLEDYVPLEECSVRVDVWNVEVDDEGPIHKYAFTDVSEARKVVGEGIDFDVWIDGKQVDSEEFLKQ